MMVGLSMDPVTRAPQWWRKLAMTSIFFWMVCVFSSCTHAPTRPSGRAVDLGKHRLTVYWLAREGRRRRQVTLYSKNRRVARVSRRFARRLRMQGSGRLRNGRLIQYAGRCKPASKRCMVVRLIDRRLFPMGVGASGMPLAPFRSVAVDTRRIPLGTRLYIPALRRALRKAGVPHHGCVIADDRGGRIRGRKVDLFVGNRGLFRRYLGKRKPRYVRVYARHPRCERIPKRSVARR